MSNFTYHSEWHPDGVDLPARTFNCSVCHWMYYEGDSAFITTLPNNGQRGGKIRIYVCSHCTDDLIAAKTRALLEN